MHIKNFRQTIYITKDDRNLVWFKVDGWHGYEQLPRSMYYSCKKAKEKWGIAPSTALFADLGRLTWSAISAYSGAGLKYAAIFDNKYLRSSKKTCKM
jgi:hypothetical protein